MSKVNFYSVDGNNFYSTSTMQRMGLTPKYMGYCTLENQNIRGFERYSEPPIELMGVYYGNSMPVTLNDVKVERWNGEIK